MKNVISLLHKPDCPTKTYSLRHLQVQVQVNSELYFLGQPRMVPIAADYIALQPSPAYRVLIDSHTESSIQLLR